MSTFPEIPDKAHPNHKSSFLTKRNTRERFLSCTSILHGFVRKKYGEIRENVEDGLVGRMWATRVDCFAKRTVGL